MRHTIVGSGLLFGAWQRRPRIILQTPPDPIVATLRSPNPVARRAETSDAGRPL